MRGPIGFGAAFVCLAATTQIARAEVNQPQEIIMRPLTTPGGQITVAGDLGILIIPDVDTGIALRVGGSYGINDQLEVGIDYAFALKEFEAKGDLVVEAAYNVMEGDLSVSPNLLVGYSFLAEGMEPLAIGARARFRINEQMAVYTPGGQLEIALEETAPIPPATEGARPIVLGLPVGFQFQATPEIHAFAQTSLASISISDSETAVIFADFIPLTIGGFYSPSNTMDFGASIGWFDLKEASDVIAIIGSARLHL